MSVTMRKAYIPNAYKQRVLTLSVTVSPCGRLSSLVETSGTRR